jgi:uncharacterized protein (DUF1499 family)
MQPTLGLINQVLTMCDEGPNCVNSQTHEDSEHFIEPFVYETTWQGTKQMIFSYLNSNSYDIVVDREDYIYATQKSKYYGMVDDIEFYFLEDVLHFRSSSRVGFYDFESNTQRVNKIKEYLSKPSE